MGLTFSMAEGRLHYVDGEPANIAKTYGNRYRILADLYILPISPYSPVMAPGAIQFAKFTALKRERFRGAT